MYICPMHPEVTSDKKGRCPKCGMELEKNHDPLRETSGQARSINHETNSKKVLGGYMPLIVVVSLILITSLTISFPVFHFQTIVSTFMAGFFIVFAGFKLIDLKGFAAGYTTYDLLAKRWFAYGYIYPFIELGFGLFMVLGLFDVQVLILEIIVMTFSGIGVAVKLMKKEKFQCVCLGTFLKVPLTKVTLIEDFGMALLALILLTQFL